MLIGGHNFESGDPITCLIRDSIVEGAIYFDSRDRAWICHHVPEFNGDDSPDKLGYEYSWVLSITSYNLTGSASEVVNISPRTDDGLKYKHRYLNDETTITLLGVLTYEEYRLCFFRNIEVFEGFDHITLAAGPDSVIKPGMITLRGLIKTPFGPVSKKIDIKLSRYIRRVFDTYTTYLKTSGLEGKWMLSDKRIEEIQNKFVAATNGEGFEFELLSGDQINYGYLTENYAGNNGTLGKSCMSNKTRFLSIYKQNSCCQLAVLKSENGIEARCFIWTINDKVYFDRIYYTTEWVNKLMLNKVNQLGYIDLRKQKEVMITLQYHDFESYPYIDSFRFHRKDTNEFYWCEDIRSLPSFGKPGDLTEYRVFCSTCGEFDRYTTRKH